MLGKYFRVSAAASTLLNNLISYWTMDEASGARVDSVVASANDLTDNNTVTQNPGIIANAAQFTAANNEYLSHADNASLSTGNIDFTVACWVYMDTKPNGVTVICKEGSTTAREYRVDYVTDNFRFITFTAAGGVAGIVNATTFGSPSTATWYFIVAWHDSVANTVNISVNNGTADSASESGNVPADTTGIFYFGCDGSNGSQAHFWNGRIDEAGFWKRTLTSGEKTSLYNSGAGRSYPFVGG